MIIFVSVSMFDHKPERDQLWHAMFYQPPHDINHHPPGPW